MALKRCQIDRAVIERKVLNTRDHIDAIVTGDLDFTVAKIGHGCSTTVGLKPYRVVPTAANNRVVAATAFKTLCRV